MNKHQLDLSSVCVVKAVGIIYPKNIKKYGGSILQRTNGSYLYRLSDIESRSFPTLYEAESYRRYNAIQLKRVKNIIYKYSDRYEVDIGAGQRAIFDPEDLPLIEEHLWICKNYGSSLRMITSSGDSFCNMIMNHRPNGRSYIRFIDGNTLNNRKSNLLIVPKLHHHFKKKSKNIDDDFAVLMHFITNV
jgi:hypothetical protein